MHVALTAFLLRKNFTALLVLSVPHWEWQISQLKPASRFWKSRPSCLSIEMNNFPSSLIMLQIELLKAQLTFNERLDGWTNEWLHGQFDFNGPCSKGWKAFCSYFWTARCSWRRQARTTNWTMTETEMKKYSKHIRSDGNTKAGIKLLTSRFLEKASLQTLNVACDFNDFAMQNLMTPPRYTHFSQILYGF